MALKMRKNKARPLHPDCPLTECMGIIGGAWTANVIWSLSAGARRFSELRADIPKVSPKVLTTRLRELESSGVITRKVKPTSPPSVEYQLTALGEELLPAIDALVEVGHKLKSRNAAK